MNKTYNEYRITFKQEETGRIYIISQYTSRTGEITGAIKIKEYFSHHKCDIIDLCYVQTLTTDQLKDMSLYVDLSSYLNVESWYDDYSKSIIIKEP